MTKAIIVENIKKSFKTKERRGFKGRVKIVEALKGVSFSVKKGEIFGLLGPNGAGKTTTIKILSTLLLPDAGDAYVNGYHIVKDDSKVREQLGVMLYVEKGLYRKLTGRENLEYFAYLNHIPHELIKKRVNYLLDLVEMKEHADKLVEEYSLGMKARISFARALITDAPVLFLDEPTLGLDPTSARKIREIIKNLAKKGKTILLTTHNMWEADILCDRIAIIDHGRILVIGTPDQLKSIVRDYDILIIDVRGEHKGISKRLNKLSSIKYVNVIDISDLRFKLRIGLDKADKDIISEVINVLYSENLKIENISLSKPSLEDVFIKLTGGKI